MKSAWNERGIAMGRSVKVGAVLTATVMASGVYFASTALAGSPANTPGVRSSVANAPTVPPRVFAVLNPDGSLVRGKAVASTQHISTGVYDVRFNRNISSCAWTGSIGFGTFGGSTGPSEISVTGRSATNNGLFVQTFAGASAADLPFTVLVVCS
jgi:hypothetical protein